MLTLVGLGLCDGTDITVRGRQAVEEAEHVYIESYTSILQCTHEELEEELDCTIKKLNRADVEVYLDRVLEQAKTQKVVILVIGDAFGATTHADLYLRAKQQGISVQVVHNASIISAVGAVGLELYKYGKTVSIPYWQPGFEPTSFLDGIKENAALGLHTLCLLDIKTDEKHFMSVSEAIAHLHKAEAVKHLGVFRDDSLVVGVARMGSPDQEIIAGPASDVAQLDFGSPPHCLIIPGKLHHIEEDMLALWRKKN